MRPEQAPTSAAPQSSKPAYLTGSERARTTRSGSETRARSQLINIRINDDERQRWTAFAQGKGMSLAGLLRLSVEAAMLNDSIREAYRG